MQATRTITPEAVTRLALAMALCAAGMASAQPNPNREEPGSGRDPRLSPGQIAPILEGLGDHSHPITCKNDRVQLFFDQGLRLAYAFNHKEAARAFREAIRLDPECAMAYWGLALVRGPNLNMPMDDEGAREAFDAIQKAHALTDKVTDKERAHIEAMATRFEAEPKPERAHLDQAYAEAMARLAQQYPDNPDVLTLYGAALMNLGPWDYWYNDGRPYERTEKAIAAFQAALEQDPDHAGALHYYIHVVEAKHPQRAEDAADRLVGLMPGAGHIVHMPSHIYMRVGRFKDAYDANVQAVKADEGYITQCRAQGIYPLAYYPHNIHFLWSAATNLGKSKEAIDAARKCQSRMTPEILDESPQFQTFYVVPYYALTRFGKWDEILAEPKPDDDLLFAQAVWHYARGSAYRGKGDLDKACEELDALKQIVNSGKIDPVMWQSPPEDVLTIGIHCLEGEIESAAGNYKDAIYHLGTAVRLQDALPYNEPPDWHYPVRQSLGAVLLEAGRAKEAEVVYWDELRHNPENGWTLFGLGQSLVAQDKTETAEEIRVRFEHAWAEADVKLTSSRF